MSVRSAVFILVISAFCISFACAPVTAIYTISDLSGGSIVRGHQFTIDITGKPNTAYYIWLPRTWPLSGEAYDQPPIVIPNQVNVEQDPETGPYTIGSYQYYNGNGRTILDDVAPSSSLLPNTSYYALVTTDSKGHAVLAFGTSVNTAVRSYSVRVENPSLVNTDTSLVQRGDTKVSRGQVSIEAIVTRPTRPVTTPTTTEIITPIPTLILTETTSVPVPVTSAATTPAVPVDTILVIIAVGTALCAVRHR
ncbi:MAG TPA: hypothetical protein PKM50_02955 [Methanoregula sp.]|nr:hypothetical protein [Methanoregula sp.]